MADRKKNKKAEAAMEIADKFKEIVALADLIRAKVWEVNALIGKEEESDISIPTTFTLGLRGGSQLMGSQAARKQAIWHNIAFGRGYFETVEGPRKLSKSDVYK